MGIDNAEFGNTPESIAQQHAGMLIIVFGPRALSV
jgi:hypothetical protein